MTYSSGTKNNEGQKKSIFPKAARLAMFVSWVTIMFGIWTAGFGLENAHIFLFVLVAVGCSSFLAKKMTGLVLGE